MKNLILVILVVVMGSFVCADNYILPSLKGINEPVYIDSIYCVFSVGEGLDGNGMKPTAESLLENTKWSDFFKAYEEAYGIKIIQSPSLYTTVYGSETDLSLTISQSDGNRIIHWQGTETNSLYRYYGRIWIEVAVELNDTSNIIESTARFAFAIYDGEKWNEADSFLLLWKEGTVFEGLAINSYDDILTDLNKKWDNIVATSIRDISVTKPGF